MTGEYVPPYGTTPYDPNVGPYPRPRDPDPTPFPVEVVGLQALIEKLVTLERRIAALEAMTDYGTGEPDRTEGPDPEEGAEDGTAE